MPTPTGVSVLDDMLNGGLPDNRAVLFIGGPGTGKSTLAMQFLQEGLERDERCLFISTEQTPGELRDSFAPYNFDLDHEMLEVNTIHARPGVTLEEEGSQMVLDTLSDMEVSSEGIAEEGGFGQLASHSDGPKQFGRFRTPFTTEEIQENLGRFGPCDRVVFDSISGLEVLTEDTQIYRRCILDFIRLFTDQFGATTVFTAEEAGHPRDGPFRPSGMLQFNTHGVIQLWREQVNGDYHRFVQIKKMRGVDHATQSYEMEFDPQGVHLVPENRTAASTISSDEALRTGISGLDHLCGGGFIEGGTALLDHDGRASVNPIVGNMIVESVRADQSIVLLPPSSLEPTHLDTLIAERVGSVRELLENDRLFVLDLSGSWDAFSYNVFSISDYERVVRRMFGGLNTLVSWKMKRIFKRINARRSGRPALSVVFTEAMLQEFSPNEVRQLHQWAKKNLFVPTDTVLFVQNPAVMDETLSEIFVLDAQQLLRTWIHENGLQYIKLEKSPTGQLGSSRLVEHVDYPPYVRVQRTRSTGLSS